jgi:hypothetical protein
MDMVDTAPAAVRAVLQAHRATLTTADQVATFGLVERLVVRSYVAVHPLALHPYVAADGTVYGTGRRRSSKTSHYRPPPPPPPP